MSDNTDDFKFYRVNKKIDWLLDHVPYGWRVYDKWHDLRRWSISTYQKIRYGHCDEECWNLDQTLAKIIHAKLVYFKKMKRVGYPARICSDYGFTNEQEDLCIQKWEEILDEMIFAFDYIVNDEKYAPFPEELMRKHANSENLSEDLNREKTPQERQIWDQYMKKCENLDDRKKMGLELFSKYIEHLWD